MRRVVVLYFSVSSRIAAVITQVVGQAGCNSLPAEELKLEHFQLGATPHLHTISTETFTIVFWSNSALRSTRHATAMDSSW